MSLQPIQNKLVELGLFYQDGSNIYHVICKKILQTFLPRAENSVLGDDEYDYEFFFKSSHDPTAIFHVTCKLLSCSSIVNLLNKEIYGMDFDVKDLKRRYLLTLYQKLNLEENLKQILPSYFLQFHTADSEAMLNSDDTLNFFHENIEDDILIGINQDGFERNWSTAEDCISHQNENSYINHPNLGNY
ncbi:uncharacterized protein OCT59_009055 [Rhizophagus irregularis]|uniref:Uncharacterized protein n=3 Tax=Rhizophagus irregularis TaxID=588596 RepID=U9UPM6_RHIID|nr:hypothetical protein GLOIN_2v1775730 [Rhizophagus irregularis DAOM 181602=DAOM 197198]EXX50316.1 hypothetical protein RirG_271980 [Rhizophagus irregularis DAOM 197198w]PKK73681.1 hypothetical protein RhiirC2_775724 [Rhizophagus irregularis]POG70596.1 hypothetical protein GLOIN_2v1775730 [Rhizophagus irregularis DAOM 181602=DAOM 197198]UZO17714.1 hypothetical protein OCT59_009055 [Rhizophagus irregularis]CAB4392168.1 unnamed protein product [Rhizophagus irregularis]|eukprot:XP_025177462.1 hypothetical protein GLOIN_2v1775730 [Rhizophagus irregularis DAOM 181602=DAOM 197198]